MFIKAPTDILDFEWDWSVWLPTGDSIASVAWTLQSGITQANLPAPSAQSAVASTTGGSLAANTYYYVAVAVNSAGTTTKSNEVSVTTTGSTSSVTLTLTQPVPGASGYRWYRGTSSGGENVYYPVSGMTTTTFTDTGGSSTAGSPPSSNTATNGGFSGTAAYLWVSGGTVANTYTVTCQITSAAGRVAQNTQNMNVVNL